jgi:transglutaminase-like putative cysteine protease
MTILNVRHTTVYRYRRPVRLGDHRLMLRPRDSHDLGLIRTSLDFSPAASVRWIHDVFGNSTAIASFAESAAELRIESRLETYVVERPRSDVAPEAVSYPFRYSADDRIDLGVMLKGQYSDSFDRLRSWARSFVRRTRTDTLALLGDLNVGIKASIKYQSRKPRGRRPRLKRSTAAGGRAVISPCY